MIIYHIIIASYHYIYIAFHHIVTMEYYLNLIYVYTIYNTLISYVTCNSQMTAFPSLKTSWKVLSFTTESHSLTQPVRAADVASTPSKGGCVSSLFHGTPFLSRVVWRDAMTPLQQSEIDWICIPWQVFCKSSLTLNSFLRHGALDWRSIHLWTSPWVCLHKQWKLWASEQKDGENPCAAVLYPLLCLE